MFSGIVEGTAKVVSKRIKNYGMEVSVKSKILRDIKPGDSIAVNGVCLTATKIRDNIFSFDISPETIKRTNLSYLKTGEDVNIERPVRADSRLSGHIVQGHVDCTLKILSISKFGDFYRFEFSQPHESVFIIEKGFVAIDGISLTVSEIKQKSFIVDIIPTTYNVTNLKSRKVKDIVNFEADITLKFLKKLFEKYKPK